MIGCASMSLADGGHNAAAPYHVLAKRKQVTPHLPFLTEEREVRHEPVVPPLSERGAGAAVGWAAKPNILNMQISLANAGLCQRSAKLRNQHGYKYLQFTILINDGVYSIMPQLSHAFIVNFKIRTLVYCYFSTSSGVITART